MAISVASTGINSVWSCMLSASHKAAMRHRQQVMSISVLHHCPYQPPLKLLQWLPLRHLTSDIRVAVNLTLHARRCSVVSNHSCKTPVSPLKCWDFRSFSSDVARFRNKTLHNTCFTMWQLERLLRENAPPPPQRSCKERGLHQSDMVLLLHTTILPPQTD